MKKWVYIVGVIVLAILMIITALVSIKYVEYQQSGEFLAEGLELLRAGQYEAGLAKCEQMAYSKVICYTTLLGLKLGRNETITADLCEKIIYDAPSWEKGNLQVIEISRQTCYCMVEFNDKERCLTS